MPRAIEQASACEVDVATPHIASAESTRPVQVFSGLRRQDCCWKVRLSYIEIYNETFRDLLNPDTPAADLSVTEKKCGLCKS